MAEQNREEDGQMAQPEAESTAWVLDSSPVSPGVPYEGQSRLGSTVVIFSLDYFLSGHRLRREQLQQVEDGVKEVILQRAVTKIAY